MSLNHKNVVRNGDEYSCARCGKSWSIDDTDPPECVAVVAFVGKGVRTMRSGPGPEMQNLPKVADGNDMTHEQMREAAYRDFAELEKRVCAHACSNPGCSQRSTSMPPAMAYPYGQAMTPYIVSVQHWKTSEWIGVVIYAASADLAVEYFTRVYANNTSTYGEAARIPVAAIDSLCVDAVLGYTPNRQQHDPWAEMNPNMLEKLSRHNTRTRIEYRLYNPLRFIAEVNRK